MSDIIGFFAGLVCLIACVYIFVILAPFILVIILLVCAALFAWFAGVALLDEIERLIKKFKKTKN